MKKLQYHEYGSLEVMSLTEVPLPVPQADEIRIVVRASGVNPSDWTRRSGMYRDFDEVSFPAGPGVQASGIVDATGPGVTDVSAGDAVFGMGQYHCAITILDRLMHNAQRLDMKGESKRKRRAQVD